MSNSESRLYTPRTSRRPSLRPDPEAVGAITESIARFFGTGRYLLIQTILVLVWIVLNVGAIRFRWDPYPFTLLNLAFSTQAAYAAPLILAGPKPSGKPRPGHPSTRIGVAPPRRRPTPNTWPASWPRCDWLLGEVPTREHLRLANWRICAARWPICGRKTRAQREKKSQEIALRNRSTIAPLPSQELCMVI